MSDKAKILMVDDDPDFVEAIKIMLENKSYQVVTACNGQEGKEKVEQEKPDLIILDVMMPKKHGFELCKELKKNPDFAQIPVLLLTAVGENIPTSTYSVQMGLDTEADDYLEKPVEPDVLIARVEELLQRKNSN